MTKNFFLVFLSLLSLVAIGCSEAASTGETVDIPVVRMDCVSTDCMQNVTPTMYAFITTSGCSSPAFGTIRAMSTNSINCTAGSGCTGFLSGWIDQSSASTTTMPSGTYSICVIVDYNGDYSGSGSPASGDSYGELNNIVISGSTGTQFVTSFSDIP
jgi:hypothetical protein